MNLFAMLILILPLAAPLPSPTAAPFVDLLSAWPHDHRECAEHALRCLGAAAEGNLEWSAFHHHCPDVRRRCERLLGELDWLADTPWIDFPESASRWLWMGGYLERARECGAGCGGPDWSDYRAATTLFLRDLRRAGVPESRREELRAYMVFREAEWWAKQRAAPPAP